MPDSNILLDFMIHRLKGVLANLVVYPENMRANLESSRGWCVPGPVVGPGEQGPEPGRGLPPDPAGRHAGLGGRAGHLKERVLADPEIGKYLSTAELEELFDLKHHLRHVDELFQEGFRRIDKSLGVTMIRASA